MYYGNFNTIWIKGHTVYGATKDILDNLMLIIGEKILDPFQKEAVSLAVHIDLNIMDAKIIRNLTNVDDERVQFDHGLKASVDRLVRHERDAVFTKVLGGVKVGGPSCEEVKKLRKYCEER